MHERQAEPQNTAIDLFAGAGGVTAGLRKAHFEVLAAVEIDPEACATYAANHRDVLLKRADILTVDPNELRAELGMQLGDLTLLGACAPCQGFSSIGARRPNDPRNDLVLAVLPFVETFRPNFVAFENVPSLEHDPRFVEFCRRLRELGYGVRAKVVDAADYGVAQRRRRLVALAAIGVPDNSVPFLLAPKPGAQRTPIEVAWEELVPIDSGDPLHTTPNHPLQVLARIRAIPANGGSRSDLPESLRLRCHERIGKHATNVYGRMRWGDVGPTMTTRCVTPSCGRFVHPDEHRAITLREATLLQSFDINYKWLGGRMSIARQIGNAVPVMLAEAIGRTTIAANL